MLVEAAGIEPATYALQRHRSPAELRAPLASKFPAGRVPRGHGTGPGTPAPSRRQARMNDWWAKLDLNQ